MSVIVSHLMSSAFRVKNSEEFSCTQEIIETAKIFDIELKIELSHDDYWHFQMFGNEISMIDSDACWFGYPCEKTGIWVDDRNEEDKTNFNICEYIKKHIHPEDKCVAILSGTELHRNTYFYQVAVITSTDIQFDKYTVGPFRHYKASES